MTESRNAISLASRKAMALARMLQVSEDDVRAHITQNQEENNAFNEQMKKLLLAHLGEPDVANDDRLYWCESIGGRWAVMFREGGILDIECQKTEDVPFDLVSLIGNAMLIDATVYLAIGTEERWIGPLSLA